MKKQQKERIIMFSSIITLTILAFIAYKMNINFKMIMTVYNIIYFIGLIFSYFKEYRYKKKYEPLLNNKYLDLSDLIDHDDDDVDDDKKKK